MRIAFANSMRFLVSILICILLLTLGTPVRAEEGTTNIIGFESFSIQADKIVFSCKNQCFYIVGKFDKGFDYLVLDPQLKGKGNFGYGFFNGKEIIPGEIRSISDTSDRFYFSKLSFYSQLTTDIPVVLIFDGEIAGNIKPSFGEDSSIEGFMNAWNDFITVDTFKPYTINLLFGPRISGSTVNDYFYGVFILAVIILGIGFFLRGKDSKFLQKISIIAAILWILYDIRMSYELNGYYLKDYREYTSQQGIRNFRDRGDYYDFMNFVQGELLKANADRKKSVSFFTDNDWPYMGSARYYLLPYSLETSNVTADILIFYGYKGAVTKDNEIIVNGKKLENGTFLSFSKNAFIFIRK